MTYRNALAALKAKPEDQKMLLGGAWTPKHLASVAPDEKIEVTCGCALAELVPNMVEEVENRRTYARNPHFSSLFGCYCDPNNYNGMTYREADKLEKTNDSCIAIVDNSPFDCKERAKLVEKFLEAEVLREVEALDAKGVAASEALNVKVVSPT